MDLADVVQNDKRIFHSTLPLDKCLDPSVSVLLY